MVYSPNAPDWNPASVVDLKDSFNLNDVAAALPNFEDTDSLSDDESDTLDDDSDSDSEEVTDDSFSGPIKQDSFFWKNGTKRGHPTSCSCEEHCRVIKDGTDRRVVLDLTGVKSIIIQRYHCTTHDERFSSISPEVVDSLSREYHPNISIIVGPRLIYTTKLACFVFNTMPQVGFNFARVKRILVLHWIAGNNTSDQILTLTSYSVKCIYVAYWGLIEQSYKEAQKKLNAHTGTVLRGDHTYKIVKNISAHNKIESKRIKMKASLFSISNEAGRVLQVRIVPSDDRTKAAEVYEAVWKHHKEPKTKYVYSDNVVVDSAAITKSFESHYAPANPIPPTLLTDIYHAKMRVVKLLPRSHPDYKISVQEISSVLAKIKSDAYKSADDLALSLRQWATTFGKPTEVSKYNTNELILLLNQQRRNSKLDFRTGIVDDVVVHAIENLCKEQTINSLFRISLVDRDVPQGTSILEAWHHYLSVMAQQLSGNLSYELNLLIIQHCQLLYNAGVSRHSMSFAEKDRAEQLFLTEQFAHLPVGVYTAVIQSPSSYEKLVEQGFQPQVHKSKPIDPADVEELRRYLKINNLRTVTQRDLISHLVLECFHNKYSKSYVKKLVYFLSKDLFQ